MKPYLLVILSGCIGMTIGVSLNLYQWESGEMPTDQNTVAFVGAAINNAKKNFASGGVESAHAVGTRHSEVRQPEIISMAESPNSGSSAPPAGNLSDPEWLPNPYRPLGPQLAIYAASEPAKAAAIALSMPCEEEDPEANDPLRTVLKVWAYDNPYVAESFVNEITDPQRKLGATLGLIEGLAEHDVGRATKWIEKHINHPDVVAFISLVVPHMEPNRAEKWIADLSLDASVRALTQGLVSSRPRTIETR